MPAYYMLHEPALFQEQIIPALTASWRERSFGPCKPLCFELTAQAMDYCKRYYLNPDEPLLFQVPKGVPFDRDLWTLLAGEIFLFAAMEIPWVPEGAETLCALEQQANAEHSTERSNFTPMQCACFGRHDLMFGTRIYRPFEAGWNTNTDVRELASYLDILDESVWNGSQLQRPDLSEEDAEDELVIAHECLAALRELYSSAARRDWIMLIERT